MSKDNLHFSDEPTLQEEWDGITVTTPAGTTLGTIHNGWFAPSGRSIASDELRQIARHMRAMEKAKP